MSLPLAGKVPAGHLWYLLRQLSGEKPHRFGGKTRINAFYPPYPSLAYERFCQNIIARRRAPYSAYIAASAKCPCHCGHCSHAGRVGEELSDDQILGCIGQLRQLGACTVGFTGGEPLLRASLEKLVEACGPEMGSIIFTSGCGLDEARARSLAAAGVTCITVGLECSEAAVHDRIRGRSGSFAECEGAIAACRAAGVYCALSTIATAEKLAGGELERMYELGRAWGVGEFRVLSPVATGGKSGCEGFMLSPAQRQQVCEFHRRRNREKGGPAVASFARLESPELFGCGAGYHHLFVDAYGNVCPCDLTPLSFGNVRQESLIEIWERMGEKFARPRCGCLMRPLAPQLAGKALPLSRPESQALCAAVREDEPVPEAYRRLLRLIASGHERRK